MTDSLQCYRCGNSLDALTLPISREDQCPACTVYVHCCRMCEFYDPSIAEQCREDDAEAVKDKENANFCDFFGNDPSEFSLENVETEEVKNASEVAERFQDRIADLTADGDVSDEIESGKICNMYCQQPR